MYDTAFSALISKAHVSDALEMLVFPGAKKDQCVDVQLFRSSATPSVP